ncbi:hypothetical protein [Komagataeibacter sp. FNDCR2]|uniref:hypothetical protein n=1 Tax=Komagataeibacter sp. FNDCR2 TaxID=2878682 RepID=UPI001E3FDD44|nr:hypothetical protein [Komagataeibacter sp. FNDCR2]MCE2576677.1 hypothetical protein [Komagataeibacter sp. FNDCR2]
MEDQEGRVVTDRMPQWLDAARARSVLGRGWYGEGTAKDNGAGDQPQPMAQGAAT